MMEYVTTLEDITCKFDRIIALLAIYSRTYIDISEQRARHITCMDRGTMVCAYHAIFELASAYGKDIDALVIEYHAKALEGRQLGDE